jgi:hypothetical protein
MQTWNSRQPIVMTQSRDAADISYIEICVVMRNHSGFMSYQRQAAIADTF